MTPVNAKQIPRNFLIDIESPKRMTPIVRIDTVFKWPTMLYVSGEVAPIIKNVESETNIPRQPLVTIVMTASVLHEFMYLRHYDESLECEAARQHKVAEVAYYRLERTKGVGAPHQCSRVNQRRSGCGVCHVPSSVRSKAVLLVLFELHVDRSAARKHHHNLKEVCTA